MFPLQILPPHIQHLPVTPSLVYDLPLPHRHTSLTQTLLLPSQHTPTYTLMLSLSRLPLLTCWQVGSNS
ncbi:hypothetical protein E2C01_071131 [Portunus trituberculatus]|uniref:Uncharacterized protein n=1 Tax=Portunus trituberculatus TaxID=210409 RepID=A0A5B7I410_PORTR|nr:hypothetical protein [Portunus trituberculatus]